MVNDPTTRDQNLATEVDSALTALDNALTDARRAIQTIRSSIGQIADLERRMRAMEAAMAKALESLSAPLGQQMASISPIRPQASTSTWETAPQPSYQSEPEPGYQPQAPTPVSHCLRLTVDSKVGSLDLKSVDNAVNENLDIVDVALIDYDGRQATLKLWVNPDVDVESVRLALIDVLHEQFGEDTSIDAYIDLEEAA